jgi:hypothetical protein
MCYQESADRAVLVKTENRVVGTVCRLQYQRYLGGE